MDEGLLKYLLSLQLIETYWMNKIVHELQKFGREHRTWT